MPPTAAGKGDRCPPRRRTPTPPTSPTPPRMSNSPRKNVQQSKKKMNLLNG